MIVPMKKLALVTLKSDRDALMLSLQKCGEVMIIPPPDNPSSQSNDQAAQEAALVEGSLKFVSQYQAKKSMFAAKPELTFEELMQEVPSSEQLRSEAKQLDESIHALQQEITALGHTAEQYQPWQALDIPVDQIRDTKFTRTHMGFLHPAQSDSLLSALSEFGAEVKSYGITQEGQALHILCHAQSDNAVLDVLKEHGFTEVHLQAFNGTSTQAYHAVQKQIEEKNQQAQALTAQAKSLSERMPELEVLCDKLRTRNERLSAPIEETRATCIISGWVREDRTEQVKNAIDSVTDTYSLIFSDPEDGEKPPSVEKNNAFITPFEAITNMYSLPDPNEPDPNAVMGPWYWLVFGMMMADVGYGLVTLIGLYFFKRFKRPRGDFAKIVNILMLSSITTIIFGVVFGSYFGAEWLPAFVTPLERPVEMLIICFGIGTLHIFSGLIIKIYANIKSGNFLDAVYDQISWMLLIAGVPLLFFPGLAKVGTIVSLIGAAIILLFSGRSSKNIFARLGAGLFTLYGATGYMGDILSYSRILALSLSTAVVAMIMNVLAGMVQGSFIGILISLLIYLFGHTFNLVMGLLSAYVHSSRLQYIEFFGKFYEGNGYAFRPFSANTKYVDIIKQ